MSDKNDPKMRVEIARAIKRIQAIAQMPVSNSEKEKELDEVVVSLGECSLQEAADIALILQSCNLSIFAGEWLTRKLKAPRKIEKLRPGTPSR